MKIVGGWFCVPDIPCYFGGFDVRTGNKIGEGEGGLSGSQRGSLPVSQITSLPPLIKYQWRKLGVEQP